MTRSDAEQKRLDRLERRRGYDKAGRERRRARALAESGIQDLPLEAQVVIEEALKTTAPEPEPPKPADATVEELVTRLAAIKERIFRLHAVYAVSLSLDTAMEANRYVVLFQDVARELQTKDPDALEAMTRGHEAILSSPPIPIRKTVPIETQRWVELRWEASRSPVRHVPERHVDSLHDGLGWML